MRLESENENRPNPKVYHILQIKWEGCSLVGTHLGNEFKQSQGLNHTAIATTAKKTLWVLCVGLSPPETPMLMSYSKECRMLPYLEAGFLKIQLIQMKSHRVGEGLSTLMFLRSRWNLNTETDRKLSADRQRALTTSKKSRGGSTELLSEGGGMRLPHSRTE